MVAAPPENVNYIAKQTSHGKSMCVLRLNIPLDAERPGATIDQGVLIVALPMTEEVKPKTIQVKSK